MAFTKKNEDAVSPVIGVILMVAITVILAAVIAAFVFGMAGNVKGTKVILYTVAKDGEAITVTNFGGNDISSLSSATIKIAAGDATAINALEVGSTDTFTGDADTPERVLIIGKFTDGTEQILIDKTL
jgi:flagellin-like protein